MTCKFCRILATTLKTPFPSYISTVDQLIAFSYQMFPKLDVSIAVELSTLKSPTRTSICRFKIKVVPFAFTFSFKLNCSPMHQKRSSDMNRLKQEDCRVDETMKKMSILEFSLHANGPQKCNIVWFPKIIKTLINQPVKVMLISWSFDCIYKPSRFVIDFPPLSIFH